MKKFTYQILGSLLLLSVCLLGGDAIASSADSVATETTAALPAGKFVIDVEEIHCASCAKKLSRKLYAVKGVTKVETDVKKNQAVVYLPKDQAIEPKTIWLAAIQGKTKPTEIHYLDQTLTAEQMKQLLEVK